MPLQTMSYWIALSARSLSLSSGSSARNSSTAMFGIENGLCEKSIFFSSSLHSYIGKSTIQQNSKRSLAIRSSSSPTLVRAGPANLTNAAGSPATKKTASPCLHAKLRAQRFGASRRRHCWRPGRARHLARPRRQEDVAKPGWPSPCAQEFMRSQNAREPPPGAGIAHTCAFGSASRMRANTLKPEPRKISDTSCISIGLRRSGLSVPYLRIASRVGDERELRRHRLAAGEFLEHAAHHRLDRGEHVLLGDEAHLDVELVEFAGRTVGARVLVAEAGRDLEIAVEARHHDELLELLRRLRQRVELARMDAATAPGSRARLRATTRSGSASGTRRSPAPSCAGGSSR